MYERRATNTVTLQWSGETPIEKKAYRTPEFVNIDSIADLRQGAGGDVADGGAGSFVDIPIP